MAETHIDRKDLKTPDAFFQGVGKFNRFVTENRAMVIAGAAAVVLVFVGGMSWRARSLRAEANAAAAFLRATDAVEEDSLASAKSALVTVAASKREPYAPLASLYLAEIQLKDGSPEAAAAAYEEAAAKLSRAYLRQAALVSRGFALERAGKAGEAAGAYAEAAATGSVFKEAALRGQLRAARAADSKDLVKSALRGLVEGYPQGADAEALANELAAIGD